MRCPSPGHGRGGAGPRGASSAASARPSVAADLRRLAVARRSRRRRSPRRRRPAPGLRRRAARTEGSAARAPRTAAAGDQIACGCGPARRARRAACSSRRPSLELGGKGPVRARIVGKVAVEQDPHFHQLVGAAAIGEREQRRALRAMTARPASSDDDRPLLLGQLARDARRPRPRPGAACASAAVIRASAASIACAAAACCARSRSTSSRALAAACRAARARRPQPLAPRARL